MKTRTLIGLALVALALLPPIRDPTPITPAQAPAHEGTTVTVAGVVRDIRQFDDATRITLAADGHALHVHVAGTFHATRGAWAEATGILFAGASGLRLVADAAHVAAMPDSPDADWDVLAADPGAFQDQFVRLAGEVDGATLRRGATAVQLGDGAWPAAGAVQAEGTLAYSADCLCHRFHAGRVWTS